MSYFTIVSQALRLLASIHPFAPFATQQRNIFNFKRCNIQ